MSATVYNFKAETKEYKFSDVDERMWWKPVLGMAVSDERKAGIFPGNYSHRPSKKKKGKAITPQLGLRRPSVYSLMQDSIGIRKVTWKWAPKQLVEERKDNQPYMCSRYLER